ncbi:hypothetical protein ACFW0L_08340 [Priestia megaterium]|uniref:hypothetical protein n=1 Tax=Priestia megaterium TaxID=1404 RepID=UPI00366CF2E3
MYKKINRASFESFNFGDKVNSIFNKYNKLFFDELEYTFLVKTMESKHFSFLEEEASFLRMYKQELESSSKFEIIPSKLSPSNDIEILDGLLSRKIEGELITSTDLDELNNNQKNSKSETTLLSFGEYLQTDVYCRHQSSINSYENSFKRYYKELSIEKLYDRPLYFLLYRVRNNIIKYINERTYTIKYINKYLEELSKEFTSILYLKIIEMNFSKLNIKDKLKIYEQIQSHMIHELFMELRLGRTFEEGNELVTKVKEKIKRDSLGEKITKKSFHYFLQTLDHFDEEIVFKWLDEDYMVILENATKYLCEDLGFAFNVKSNFVKQNFKKIILGSILDASDDIEKTLEEGLSSITTKIKSEILNKHNDKYLKQSTFSVALNVEGLETEHDFLEMHINNINLLSNERFEGWQFEKFAHNNKSIIYKVDESEKASIWAIVNEVKCGVYDYEKAVLVAREKLRNFLNGLYYFIAKEGEMSYKISYSSIVFNEDQKITHWTNLGRMDVMDSKRIDEIDIDLIDFLISYEKSSNPIKINLAKAINLFIDFCRSADPGKKAYYLGNILHTIFKGESKEKVALLSSIIVAGINYDKDDVTYKSMRIWLYEDFKELLEIFNIEGHTALKERILDRFKVFSRNIIGTVLLNLFPEESEIDGTNLNIENLISWILYINPESDFIKLRGGEN